MPPTRHDFEWQLQRILGEAARDGRAYIEVEAGNLHRAVGGYPSRGNHRMPVCCSVMRAAARPGDIIVREPASGTGATLIRFRLPRGESERSAHRPPEDPNQPKDISRSVPSSEPSQPSYSGALAPAIGRIALISCVKKKQEVRSVARDLYISTFFRLTRTYAEEHSDAWFILSAEYGVLHPDRVVEPYERTLNKMSRQERAAWGERVRNQLERVLPSGAQVCLLAGELYRQPVESFLRHRGHSVAVLMRGLGIGKQLHWLKVATGERDVS